MKSLGTITFYNLEDLAHWFSAMASCPGRLSCEVIYHEDRNVWVCHIEGSELMSWTPKDLLDDIMKAAREAEKATLAKPRYPEVPVRLSGTDGNAMVLVSKVSRALREYGVCDEEITEFAEEAMSDDYDHVLQTCMVWVEVT